MSKDQLTLLTLDLRPVPDPLRSGAIFEHVQRSPPTFPTMPLCYRSLPLNLRSLPFNSRLFPMGPDFQIGSDRERIVAQWNGGMSFYSAGAHAHDGSLWRDQFSANDTHTTGTHSSPVKVRYEIWDVFCEFKVRFICCYCHCGSSVCNIMKNRSVVPVACIRAGTSNYIPQYQCDVINCPCP